MNARHRPPRAVAVAVPAPPSLAPALVAAAAAVSTGLAILLGALWR